VHFAAAIYRFAAPVFAEENAASPRRNRTLRAMLFALLPQQATRFIMLRLKLASWRDYAARHKLARILLQTVGSHHFIGNSVCVKLCAACFRRFRPRSVL